MVSSVIYSWGKDTMTQAAITCRQSHFLAPVIETLWADDLVEEILAEGEALTIKAEKFSVQ